MRRLGLSVLTLAAMVLSAGNASAQGPGRFGGGIGMLLSNKGVQSELKLDAAQTQKMDALAAETRTKMQEGFAKLQDLDQAERRPKMQELQTAINADVNKSLATVLKPEQLTRLHQIQLQQRFAGAFSDEAIATKLKLTDDQKSKIKEISDAANGQRRELFQGFQDDREGTMKKMTELNKETMGKVAALLTDDQKATWKEMTGAPYDYKMEPPPGQ